MEFVISPTLCQLRYSFQTWILQFHLSRGSDSNRDCFRIREVSSNLLDDLSIFSKITFNSAFMIFSRLTLQAISTTIVESSGKWGTRTPLLQGQYDNLWTGLIYSQVSLTSQFSMNFTLWSRWDSNPQSHNLKGWCFSIQLQDRPCALIRTRTGTPGLKVQLTNLYPMRALPKSYWLV